MRTTKRFTPQVLERFKRQGRGLGTFANYLPWHQVTRGDPASTGRSHLIYWQGRLLHLLSDKEWGGQLFGLMLAGLVDSTEQLPLALEDAPHPLSAYSASGTQKLYPGTLALARELGIKHPILSEKGQTKDWVLSTDLVLVQADEHKQLSLLAVQIKPLRWEEKRRTVELLRLEREYWVRRGVTWLLITPAEWDHRVFLTLRRTSQWALEDAVEPRLLQMARELALAVPWNSVTEVVDRLTPLAQSKHQATCALWQAAWFGTLPLDLSRGWRPQEPLRVLRSATFWNQNPIASRRSAWI
jgi:hypothetical protein